MFTVQQIDSSSHYTHKANVWSPYSLHWRHNERDGGSNHQPHDCLLNFSWRRRSKKTSKLRVTGPQKASNAENVSIWWRHYVNVDNTMVGYINEHKSLEIYMAGRDFLMKGLLNLILLDYFSAWWRHQMETFSALPSICVGNSPVTGEFTTQRAVARIFDVFLYLRLRKTVE